MKEILNSVSILGLDLDQCWAFRQFIAHILCLSGQDKPWLPLCTSPTMQLLFDREEMWEYGKSFNIQYFALWIVVFQKVTRYVAVEREKALYPCKSPFPVL